MTFEEHCKRAEETFGKPYAEVHAWLDELFKYIGPMHRRVRHNLAGVEKVRELFGEEAALVARQHIKDDGEYIPPIGEDDE